MFKKNDRFEILTPTGYENFVGVQKKYVDKLYHIYFEDGTFIKCSDNHALLCETGFVFAKDLKQTNKPTNKIISKILIEDGKFEVFDPIGVDKHDSYVSNGVVSHNCEFLGSSNTLIDGSKLQIMNFIDPIAKQGNLNIFEHPVKFADDFNKNHMYAITVDVSEGRNLDYSAFSVVDVSAIPYKQVARYRDNNISPILFPTIIYNTARLYNDAWVMVETNNNPQIAETLHNDMEYENVLKVMTGNKKAQTIASGFGRGIQLGVKMSPLVKRMGCSYLKTLIESDKFIVNDFDTLSELTTFVADNNSFSADGEANDDLVMTLVIFAWMATQKYFKDIVAHDIRKQLQMEAMSQTDEEMLPVMDVQDGLDAMYVVEDDEVWVTANGADPYNPYKMAGL